MNQPKPVVTLEESRVPSLHDVQQRRRRLLALLLIVFVVVAGGLVLFSLASERFLDRPPRLIDVGLLRLAFVALTAAFAVYVLVRERALISVERRLTEERVLTAALSNRLHELSALSKAEKAVSASLSLEDVLALILRSTRELLGATETSVMLLEPESRTLRIAASEGIDDEVARASAVPLGEGVAGWVAEYLEPVVLRGELDDPRFRGLARKERVRRSAMSAPLTAGGEPLGVLNVSISEGEREYSEHDLRALTVFADHAAIAISNARLFEREKEARTTLADLDRKRRDFLATITHDLKTPLTSILGYVKLLRRAGANVAPEDAERFTDVIERQGRRILGMVEQLLVATRLEEVTPTITRKPLDLPVVVEEQVAGFRGVIGRRRIEVLVPEDLPPVFGDPSAVEHMLANLLENAVKYTPDGARIVVEVAREPSEVRVTVADEGRGIPEDELPFVFDRYRRAGGGEKREGSVGLGLFIVRSFAAAHGGRAWAENAPGGGARVSFSLPVRSEA